MEPRAEVAFSNFYAQSPDFLRRPQKFDSQFLSIYKIMTMICKILGVKN